MRLPLFLELVLVSVLLLLGCNTGEDNRTDLLVRFKAGTDPSAQMEVLAPADTLPVDYLEGTDVHVVEVSGERVAQALAALQEDPYVEFAAVNEQVTAAFVPDDTSFGTQWGMAKINAPDAWDVTKSDSSVRIAILDTGIDLDHEDLQAKIVASKNFTFSGAGANDLLGHGTHVAGTAAAITDNALGVAGVGFNASIMNAKIVDEDNFTFPSWVADAIDWAVANGADVINISWVTGGDNTSLETAVNNAWDAGVVIVGGAGNTPRALSLCIRPSTTM